MLLSHQCCCCCFSHSAHWLPTRKKLLYTVANPARGLLNREKKKKKKSGRAPPPPPRARCSFGEKIKYNRQNEKVTNLCAVANCFVTRTLQEDEQNILLSYRVMREQEALIQACPKQLSRLLFDGERFRRPTSDLERLVT